MNQNNHPLTPRLFSIPEGLTKFHQSPRSNGKMRKSASLTVSCIENIPKSRNRRTLIAHAQLPVVSIDNTVHFPYKDGTRPPFSYASLICQAIFASPSQKESLGEIYKWITHHYPYYEDEKLGWKNSIRHNLSLNNCFVKEPRKNNIVGKGAYWKMNYSYFVEFKGGILKKSKIESHTSHLISDGQERYKLLGGRGGCLKRSSSEYLPQITCDSPKKMKSFNFMYANEEFSSRPVQPEDLFADVTFSDDVLELDGLDWR